MGSLYFMPKPMHLDLESMSPLAETIRVWREPELQRLNRRPSMPETPTAT